MSTEQVKSFEREKLEMTLEQMKKSREAMVSEANRQISQMDGAIAFLSQLLNGELDEEPKN